MSGPGSSFFSVVLDTTAPVLEWVEHPSLAVQGSEYLAKFTLDEGTATATLLIDGREVELTLSEADGVWSVLTPDEDLSDVTLRIATEDDVGNAETYEEVFSVLPPTPSYTSTPTGGLGGVGYGGSRSLTLDEWRGEEPVNVTLEVEPASMVLAPSFPSATTVDGWTDAEEAEEEEILITALHMLGVIG